MSFSFRKKIFVSVRLTFWSNCGNEWLCKAAHYLYVDLHVISAENVEILCKMLDGAGTCWWRTPRIYHRRPWIFRHWQYKSQFLLNNRPEIVDSMVGCGLKMPMPMRIWAIQKIQKIYENYIILNGWNRYLVSKCPFMMKQAATESTHIIVTFMVAPIMHFA